MKAEHQRQLEMKEEELEDVKVDDFYSEKLKELYTKGAQIQIYLN